MTISRSFPDRREMLAKIHLAKRDLALDEDSYRALVLRVTRCASSADCTRPQLVALLAEFKRLGWGAPRQVSTKAHVRKLFALWRAMCEAGIPDKPTAAGLKAFVARMTGVDDPEWLDAAQGRKVIEALKAWQARETEKRKGTEA